MIATDVPLDVFLTFPLSERDTAKLVRDSLSQAGFRVITADTATTGSEWKNDLWISLVQSDAVVVLTTNVQPPSANSLVEIGAAMAWNKPIFVLQKELVVTPPAPLQSFPRFNVARLDDLADAIRRSAAARTKKESLSSEQQAALADAFVEQALPVDRIVSDVDTLDAFTDIVNRRINARITSAQVARHLLWLRKAGRLRSLRRA
jgi:hypothetical protein